MALTSCCGCFNLKTGTIIIGVLSMISTIVTFIMTIVAIGGVEQNPNIRYNVESVVAIKVMIISVISYIVIVFSFALMLIIGAKNRTANLIFPYLCLGFASISVCIAGAIGFVSFMIIAPSIPVTLALVTMLVVTSALAFKIYLWLVIYHFYQELLAEKFGRKVNPATGKIIREPFEQDV